MSSTNKTANYNLSQYIGTDKPTYLGDYNGDMLKIDTQMKSNNTLATNADTAATVAASTANSALTKANKIGNLDNLATTTKTDIVAAINEVDTLAVANQGNIGSLSNLTTQNKTNLVSAINELNALLAVDYSTQSTAVTSASTAGEELEITSLTLAPGIYYISGICAANANVSNNNVQCSFTFGSNVSLLAGRKMAQAPMTLGGGATNWNLIQVNVESVISLKSRVASGYGILGSMCSIKLA